MFPTCSNSDLAGRNALSATDRTMRPRCPWPGPAGQLHTLSFANGHPDETLTRHQFISAPMVHGLSHLHAGAARLRGPAWRRASPAGGGVAGHVLERAEGRSCRSPRRSPRAGYQSSTSSSRIVSSSAMSAHVPLGANSGWVGSPGLLALAFLTRRRAGHRRAICRRSSRRPSRSSTSVSGAGRKAGPRPRWAHAPPPPHGQSLTRSEGRRPWRALRRPASKPPAARAGAGAPSARRCQGRGAETINPSSSRRR